MRTTRPWAAPLLLLALLLLAGVPPASSLSTAPTLEGFRDAEGELRVRVGTSVILHANLVVSHADPIVGTVVDRVLRVDLEAGQRHTFQLPGVRADMALDLRLTPATQTPARMAHVSLYDGTSLAGIPTLAATTLPEGTGDGRILQLSTFDVDWITHEESPDDLRVLATAQGHLVAGYQHAATGQLMARVSRDGGHTWGPRLVLAESPGTQWAWGFGETTTGVVRVFLRTGVQSTETSEIPWRVLDLDPATSVVTTRAGVSTQPTYGYGYHAHVLAVLGDGTALLPIWQGDRVDVWKLEMGQTMRKVASIAEMAYPGSPRIAASGTDVALVIMQSASAPAPSKIFLSRSSNGGAAFTVPLELESLTRANNGSNYAPYAESIVLDPDGTVHLLARAGPRGNGYAYTRAPRNAASGPASPDTTTLFGDNGQATLSARGQRVLVTDWTSGRQSLHESLDGGVTFARRATVGSSFGYSATMAMLPDGRAALFGNTYSSGTEPVQRGWGVVLPFDPEPTPASTLVTEERALLRVTEFQAPPANTSGSADITLHNAGDATARSVVRLLLNDAPILESIETVAPGETLRLSWPLPMLLRAGDLLEVQLEDGSGVGRYVVEPTPASWSEPTPPPSAEPSPSSQTPMVLYVTPPTAPTQGPSPTTPMAATPSAPTVPTPTIPDAAPTAGEGPGGVSPPRLILTLNPDRLSLAPGGVAHATLLVTNAGPGAAVVTEVGARMALITGARVTFEENGTFELAEGESRALPLRVELSDAPDLSAGRIRLFAAQGPGEEGTILELPLALQGPAVEPAPRGLGGLLLAASAVASTPVGVAAVAGGTVGALGAAYVALRTDWGRILGAAAVAPLYSRLKRADVLRHEVRAAIHEHIRAHPGARFEEIRKALALPAGGLQFHLRVLEREGFVRVTKEWTRRRYYAQGTPIPVVASTTEQTLSEILGREPGLTAGQVAQKLGISRQLARYHLKRLEKQGWLHAEGEGALVGYKLTR